MRKQQRATGSEFLRPLYIAAGAVAAAAAMTLLLRQETFRYRLGDALIIEGLILFLTAWLSHLKSSRLAFIAFHPFKRKTYPQDWKDRVPKLGAAPPTVDETEKELSPEEQRKKDGLARRFRRDTVLAGCALLAIGLIVQYI